MSEQKVVTRTTAIILGAVCIVLAAGMAITLIAYVPALSQIISLNTQIAQKNQNIAALNSQIAVLTAQVNSQSGQNTNTSEQSILQSQIDNLKNQIINLNNVLSLNASALLVPDQSFTLDSNSNTTIWDQTNSPLLYAGYITVQVASSSNTTFVELKYATYGVFYGNVVKVGISGTAAFPVLPGTVIITLGNTETNITVTGTATATYYY